MHMWAHSSVNSNGGTYLPAQHLCSSPWYFPMLRTQLTGGKRAEAWLQVRAAMGSESGLIDCWLLFLPALAPGQWRACHHGCAHLCVKIHLPSPPIMYWPPPIWRAPWGMWQVPYLQRAGRFAKTIKANNSEWRRGYSETQAGRDGCKGGEREAGLLLEEMESQWHWREMARLGYREVGGNSIPNRGNRPREGTGAGMWPCMSVWLGAKSAYRGTEGMIWNPGREWGEV